MKFFSKTPKLLVKSVFKFTTTPPQYLKYGYFSFFSFLILLFFRPDIKTPFKQNFTQFKSLLIATILTFSTFGASISSQTINTCGGSYDFSITSLGGCNYTFNATAPGSPTIIEYRWEIWSNGTTNNYNTKGRYCDEEYDNGVQYRFCFYGYHQIRLFITFEDYSTCYIYKTFYIACSNTIACQPDSTAYLDRFTPGVYMYYTDNAPCDGWYFAFITKKGPNCAPINYYISYIDGCDEEHCEELIGSTATYFCKNIKPNTCVLIRSEGDHCCYPPSFIRYWSAVIGESGGLPSPWNQYHDEEEPCYDWCTAWGCSETLTSAVLKNLRDHSADCDPCDGFRDSENPERLNDKLGFRTSQFAQKSIWILLSNSIRYLGNEMDLISDILLIDISGRVIASTYKLNPAAEFQLPNEISNGIFYIRYIKNGEQLVTKLISTNN